GCVSYSGCVEAAGGAPRPGSRVVKLRAAESLVSIEGPAVKAPLDQDLAVRQQCRCVINAAGVQASGATPCPSVRVVQLGAIQTVIKVVVEAADDQNLAVGQQRRCVILSLCREAAGDA